MTTFAMPILLEVAESLAQQSIGFVAAFLRFEIIGLLEVHRIDFLHLDEVHDVDGLGGGLQVDSLEIFVLQDDEFSFFVFVALHDFFPRDFFAIRLGDPLVIDRALVRFSQEFER